MTHVVVYQESSNFALSFPGYTMPATFIDCFAFLHEQFVHVSYNSNLSKAPAATKGIDFSVWFEIFTHLLVAPLCSSSPLAHIAKGGDILRYSGNDTGSPKLHVTPAFLLAKAILIDRVFFSFWVYYIDYENVGLVFSELGNLVATHIDFTTGPGLLAKTLTELSH